MPRFDTPEPIVASINMPAGSVRIRAEARTDTRVEVRPRNEDSDQDAQLAAQARVEYDNGRLRINVPRNRLHLMFGPSMGPAVEVDVELPEGSEVDADAWADFVIGGRLGPVTIQGAVGDVRIERTGRLRARSSMGDIRVGRADGPADLHTSMGAIRVGTIDGSGVLKTATGELDVGEATGDLRLKTSAGDITVEHAWTSVEAKTSAGAIRIGEVGGGTVDLRTSWGELEIGVPEDVAAWLDMQSKSGRVRSELDEAGAPADTDKKVEIHARTAYGDILVRRA